MPTKRPRPKREHCESCGAVLRAAAEWYTVHQGPRAAPRTLLCCRPCLEDRFKRHDAEAAWQATELEYFWGLDRARPDDDGDDSPRHAPVMP